MSRASRRPGRCPVCLLRWSSLCLCEIVPRIETSLRFIIVRHWKERNKCSNSARIAGLSIPSLSILDYGGRDETFDPTLLEQCEDPWLLMPELGQDQQVIVAPPERVPGTLILMDGSWRQARRMASRIPALQDLPRFVLPLPQGQVDRLREPPHPWAMSTAEAVAQALALYDNPRKATQLQWLYGELVWRVRAQYGFHKR